MSAVSPDTNQTSLIRHIVPVLAGTIITVMLTVVTTGWLSVRGLMPAAGEPMGAGALVLGTLYRAFFVVVGSHLAARLAPAGQPRIRYALAVGVLMLVVSVVAAVSERSAAPMAFLLLNIALPVPCAIVGGGTAVRAMARSGR